MVVLVMAIPFTPHRAHVRYYGVVRRQAVLHMDAACLLKRGVIGWVFIWPQDATEAGSCFPVGR